MKIDTNKLVEKKIVNLSEFFPFNDLVAKNLINKDWYSCLKEEKFQKLINSNQAIMWGYYFNDILVGVTTAFLCDHEDLENYDLIHLDPAKCIIQGETAVHPDYFGNKIQNYMTTIFFDKYKKEDYQYSIATVHPDNKYSLNNLLDKGYKINSTRDVSYGRRCIMLKEL